MKKIFAGMMILCMTSMAFGQGKDAVLGKWMNASGEAHILIYKKAGKYFGKLNWLKEPKDEQRKAKTDTKNPDASLQKRPILGLEILKNFEKKEDNVYENGTIYDPKSGKTYSCKMTLDGNKLKIRGFIGVTLLGRTEIWSRVK